MSSLCIDRSMGHVSRDSALSNVKVNGITATNSLTSCDTAPSTSATQWCQVRNGRDSFQFFATNDYASTDANASSAVFSAVDGDPLVTISGTHSGLLTFNYPGTYQISIYAQVTTPDAEEEVANSLLLCLSQTAPVVSTPFQMAVFTDGAGTIPSSGSITYITTVEQGDVFDIYNSSTAASVSFTIEDLNIAIVRIS